MTIILPAEQSTSLILSGDRWVAVLDISRMVAFGWLLLVGLWSGPAYGATLIYRNGLLGIEAFLLLILLLSALRGRVRALTDYPLLWPCAGTLILCTLAALWRVHISETHFDKEALQLWRFGEPMLRGLLLYLAIAGHPKFLRVAWFTALAGLCMQSGAAIVQHFTHVTRWYADLDQGWASGWKPVIDPLWKKSTLIPPSRAQGLTSYINLTAAMLAAALPFWGIPAVFGFTRARWLRVLLAAGGVATAAALWYTDARGPMCAVGVVIIVFALLLSGRWRMSILAAALVFVAATVTHSKYIALFVFLAACVLMTLRHWWRSRYLLPIILALGFSGSVQLVDAYLLHYQLTWRVTDTGLEDPSRLGLFRAAVKTVTASPWFGIGDTAIASRVVHLPKRLGLQYLPRTQQNFHNQYLQWAASEGIVVALACTLLVCWAVCWCWRLFRTATDPAARSLGLSAAVGLTIFLLCNLVDAHFWRIEGGGFFWSLLAVTAATGGTEEGRNTGNAHESQDVTARERSNT